MCVPAGGNRDGKNRDKGKSAWVTGFCKRGAGSDFDPQRKRENILEKETFYDLW